MINPETIIEINKEITGNGVVLSKHMIDSALSSYHYYENIENQIISIFRGIVKNHAFRDGNKRTGLIVLGVLCEKYNIPLNKNEEQLVELTKKVAEEKYSVEEITKMFF